MYKKWKEVGTYDERFSVYVEAYVIDYLQHGREKRTYYIYGKTENENSGRQRIVVMGASASLYDNDLFTPYVLLTHFLVSLEERNGIKQLQILYEENEELYPIKGYRIFYEDNPVMKNKLLRDGYEEITKREPEISACENKEKADIQINQHNCLQTLGEIVCLMGILFLLILIALAADTINSPDGLKQYAEHIQYLQKILIR